MSHTSTLSTVYPGGVYRRYVLIVDSLREGFFMFWETLWALILGFTLSGAVQSFVSREDMRRVMGDHRPRTIARTSLLGAASSSCSYAASSLAKSLFSRGADFTASMVFMFASTNLVVELGIVLWLLMGWQFALAEFVGGTIMIGLFTLVAPRVFPRVEIEAARARLAPPTSGHQHHGHGQGEPRPTDPLLVRLRNRRGWIHAAGYTIADLRMLRREIAIGYLVAGLLAVAVPMWMYNDVFSSGHGWLTDLENVIVGPFVAFISFVCSIGNVPLAAALYKGGISFGGTVAFIFADLIALPLVLIYTKLYGRRLAVRMFFAFWALMSVSGLLVDLIFRAVRIPFPVRPHGHIAMSRITWNHTTALNIVFLIVFAGLFVLQRRGKDSSEDSTYATDPICGMQVERAHAAATVDHGGVTQYFCSDRCATTYSGKVGA